MNDFIIQFLTMITSEFHNRLNDNNFRFNLFFLVFSVGVTPLIKIGYTKAFKSIKRIATKEQDKSHLESSKVFKRTKYILYIISKGIGLLKTKVKPQSQKGGNKCMVKSVPTGVLHKTYKEFPRDNIQIEEFSIQIPKNLKH